MCLKVEHKKGTVAKMKRQAHRKGYIRVYKACTCDFGIKCSGWYFGRRYRQGMQVAKVSRDGRKNEAGFYAYLTKEGTKCVDWMNCKTKVCYAKPEWLKRAGKDNAGNRVGIFTKLVFPNWDKGDMTIREFKALCKAGTKARSSETFTRSRTDR